MFRVLKNEWQKAVQKYSHKILGPAAIKVVKVLKNFDSPNMETIFRASVKLTQVSFSKLNKTWQYLKSGAIDVTMDKSKGENVSTRFFHLQVQALENSWQRCKCRNWD